MKYTQRRNAKLMILMIFSVWILSALISIPPLFGWGRASKTLEKQGICLVSQDYSYQIYATLLAFYIPLSLMIIIYIKIYRTANKIKKKELKTSIRLNDSASNNLINTENIQAISKYSPIFEKKLDEKSIGSNEYNMCKMKCSNSHLSTSFNLNLNGAAIDSKKKFFNKMKSNSSKMIKTGSVSEVSYRISNRSLDSKVASSVSSQDTNAIINSNMNVSNSIVNTQIERSNLSLHFSRGLTKVFYGIKRPPNSLKSKGKNQKATQTLGIIMGCFILCW
jgi:5-hydroxytryptamine receptor 7